jgi:hypothetical protein
MPRIPGDRPVCVCVTLFSSYVFAISHNWHALPLTEMLVRDDDASRLQVHLFAKQKRGYAHAVESSMRVAARVDLTGIKSTIHKQKTLYDVYLEAHIVAVGECVKCVVDVADG